MKYLVHGIQLKPKEIQYILGDDMIRVSVGGTHKDWQRLPMAVVECVSFIPSKEIISIKLGSERIACRFVENSSDDEYTLILECLEDCLSEVLVLLQYHLEFLFPKDPCVQVQIKSVDCLLAADVLYNVTNTAIKFDEFTPTELENHLANNPNHESINILSKPSGRDLKCNSKLWKIEGLAFEHSRTITCRIMKYFSGRCLILFNANLKYSPWIQLIQKWKKKEAYGDLHAVIVQTPEDVYEEIDSAKLLQECNAVQWDGLRRPQMFKFDPRIINISKREPKMWDCSDWYDIQQDNGGKWASISITWAEIVFVVWD
ncbi:hypothetical protein GCK72_013396 [Caenorhabditis remanei]|uniref:F-box associated domain-containing protein n=1 Tax=Caenorhabditis remanei TaxID=31234 RepID=A0A6A5GQJ6_CAERE|nr:hypothetical protein GCK72_013396 [Caenorhabditis remanei]KAF1756941.1 hypothetical protein GCK72_013396 [Caenorhabditis remanei]